MNINVEIKELDKVSNLEIDWLEVECDSNCHLLLTWRWVSEWLAFEINKSRIYIIKALGADELFGIGIITKSRKHSLFGYKNNININEFILLNNDCYSKINGLVIKKGHETEVYKAVLYNLLYVYKKWDELHLDNLNPSIADYIYQELNKDLHIVKYVSTIPDNIVANEYTSKRGNSINTLCQDQNRITIRTAKTKSEALEYFRGLALILIDDHGRYLNINKRDSELIIEFYKSIILKYFNEDEFLISVFYGPDVVVGYSYSLIFNNNVYVLMLVNNDEINNGSTWVDYIIKSTIDYNHKKGRKVYNFCHSIINEEHYKFDKYNGKTSLVIRKISLRSMLKQISLNNAINGYIFRVAKTFIIELYKKHEFNFLKSIRTLQMVINKEYYKTKVKYLLVGSESSGTTAVANLLFQDQPGIRYLEEGIESWVWGAYRDIYNKRKYIQDFPQLMLFDAIKVPGFSVILAEFKNFYPNTKIIYMVRDPRDFINSAINTWKINNIEELHKIPWADISWLGINNDDPIESLALRWKIYLNKAEIEQDIIFVKYEDYYNDKFGTIKYLCDILKLSFNEKRFKELSDQQLSHKSVRYYKPKGPGGWKNSILRREDISKVEIICKEDMRKWGYS